VIRPSVELTVGALRRTIASAGLRDEDLSAVLLAGGSSRVPLVTQLVFEEFDRPVRVTQHPKFTVALGAATVAAQALAAPAVVPPPTEPAVAPARARRRWLVPTAAAALVVVAALVATLLLAGGDDGHAVDAAANTKTGEPATTTTPTTTTAAAPGTVAAPGTGSAQGSVDAPPPAPEPLRVFGDRLTPPYRVFIGSPEKWDGTEVVGESASHAAISASVADGLRVTWHGGAPAQVYLQTVGATRDLSSYVDKNGALRFDVLVHSSGGGATSIATHCDHPCGAQLNATRLFQHLPVGKRTQIAIPLSCFTEMGLNKTVVDTPFLIYAEGPLDVTFRDVQWVAGAADDTDAIPCSAFS